jgi:hypothetical protein
MESLIAAFASKSRVSAVLSRLKSHSIPERLESEYEGDRAVIQPLQFDPFESPDQFVRHCRQEHPEFWMPRIKSSAEIIPNDIA